MSPTAGLDLAELGSWASIQLPHHLPEYHESHCWAFNPGTPTFNKLADVGKQRLTAQGKGCRGSAVHLLLVLCLIPSSPYSKHSDTHSTQHRASRLQAARSIPLLPTPLLTSHRQAPYCCAAQLPWHPRGAGPNSQQAGVPQPWLTAHTPLPSCSRSGTCSSEPRVSLRILSCCCTARPREPASSHRGASCS